jgi:hypothetical protein
MGIYFHTFIHTGHQDFLLCTCFFRIHHHLYLILYINYQKQPHLLSSINFI